MNDFLVEVLEFFAPLAMLYGGYLFLRGLVVYFPATPVRSWQPTTPKQHQLKTYVFPDIVLKTFEREHPEYSAEQRELAFRGLREYFVLHDLAKGEQLGMPSLLVDQAWHSFILCTREYEGFCLGLLRKMIHHCPDVDAKPQNMANASEFKPDVVNTWRAVEDFRHRFGNEAALNGPAVLFSADSTAKIDGWIWPASALERLAAEERTSRRSSATEASAAGAVMYSGAGDSAPSSSYSSSCGSSSSTCGTGDSGSSCGGSGCGGGGGCGGG